MTLQPTTTTFDRLGLVQPENPSIFQQFLVRALAGHAGLDVKPNPYLITGPATISFSGGRTSAYMLHQIVQAHGGRLPDDVYVVFANTGKEREETLKFVHECGERWGVKIHWVEWRDGKPGFEEVTYETASRNGEPFEALINKKKRLPNWRQRWCTIMLKIETMTKFLKSRGLTPGGYTEVVGLRDDEGHRILKGLENAEKYGNKISYPLSKAKVTKADVMAFWSAQPFDLGLQPHEGNCDLCFMKGKGLRKQLIADNPAVAAWWSEQEIKLDGFFDRRDRVAQLVEAVRTATQPAEPVDETEEYDTECGLTCAPADAMGEPEPEDIREPMLEVLVKTLEDSERYDDEEPAPIAAPPIVQKVGSPEIAVSPTIEIINADVFAGLASLPDESVNCVVTSPPYWGLRNYLPDGHSDKAREIGQESTLAEHIAVMVRLFREVRRVLKPDGTFWLNYGDAYCNTDKWGGGGGNTGKQTVAQDGSVPSWAVREKRQKQPGLKPKDLLMIPNRLAIALQEDGWWVRSEIIWSKPNPMPESVRDRPTGAHEKVFLLTKSERYFYDAEAVREAAIASGTRRADVVITDARKPLRSAIEKRHRSAIQGGQSLQSNPDGLRNLRNVWTITPKPFKGAHFATFPPELAEKCIKAGCPAGGVVLDVFGGSGTTALAARELGRNSILIELNPEYCEIARKRLGLDMPANFA